MGLRRRAAALPELPADLVTKDQLDSQLDARMIALLADVRQELAEAITTVVQSLTQQTTDLAGKVTALEQQLGELRDAVARAEADQTLVFSKTPPAEPAKPPVTPPARPSAARTTRRG